MKTRILVAEDERPIRLGLVEALESEGHEVVAAADGREALALATRGPWDIVLLDVMMPGASGYDVCTALRRVDARVPVIFLTAKAEEVDIVVGLRLGADDYVTKPFGVRELLARIDAALRRARLAVPSAPDLPDAPPVASRPDAAVRCGAATLDRRRIELRRDDGAVLPLTPRELALIEVFLRRPGEVLSRDLLLDAVWGVGYPGTTRTLDQHVAQLRRKLEPHPDHPRHLQTIHGFGYRYDP